MRRTGLILGLLLAVMLSSAASAAPVVRHGALYCSTDFGGTLSLVGTPGENFAVFDGGGVLVLVGVMPQSNVVLALPPLPHRADGVLLHISFGGAAVLEVTATDDWFWE